MIRDVRLGRGSKGVLWRGLREISLGGGFRERGPRSLVMMVLRDLERGGGGDETMMVGRV